MKFKRELVGTTTIDISGVEAKVSIYRNEDGNLERQIENELDICPDGTCLEGYGEEMVIYKFVQ